MIIDQKKTTLAYRCPKCGVVPTSIVGAFSLSGDLFKLKCDNCHSSALTVEKLKDGKIRLTVPCVACPQPHTYILSTDVFFNSDTFIIPCSLCGIDICFIGKENKVAEAIKYSNEEILRALGDASIDSLKSDKKNELSDPQVVEIVTYVVSELNEEGKIFCGCKEGQGDYECNVYNDFVTVKCKKCHRSATIPADSTIAAHDFLNADKLTLS